MQRFKLLPGRVASIVTTTSLALFACLVQAGGDRDGNVSAAVASAHPDATAQAPVATQGMRAYRDPKTGSFGPPPPDAQPPGLSAAEVHMLNRSDSGLQSRTLPGGGVAVNLQGRYRSMAVATIGANRKVAVSCAPTREQAEEDLRAGQQTRTGPAN